MLRVTAPPHGRLQTKQVTDATEINLIFIPYSRSQTEVSLSKKKKKKKKSTASFLAEMNLTLSVR